MTLRTFLAALALALCADPLVAQRARMVVPLNTLIERARVDSNDAPTQYEVALGYWLAKRYDDAEFHLRQAILIEPSTAAAYLALSYLPYARRNKLWDEEEDGRLPAEWQPVIEEAWAFRRKAFLIDPLVDLKPLALMIPPAGVFGLRGNAQAVYTYVMNGFGSFWDGQYARAYQFFREIAGPATDQDRKDKFNSWFLWYEALAAAHANDLPRATSNMRILLARAEAAATLGGGATLAFSDATHYRYTLACILDLGGEHREAIALLQQALTEDVGLYPAHVRLARIYEDQHRTNAALEERRRAVASNPEDPSLLFDLGESLARAGELVEAHGVLRQAVQANPRSHRALYVLGFVAQQVGSKDEARGAYTRFLELAPSRFETQKAEARRRLEALN
jgi:tetratricopeptide (TPR) repeat protein